MYTPRWERVLGGNVFQVENYSGWKISWVGTVPNYTQESHLDFQGVFSLGGKYFPGGKKTQLGFTPCMRYNLNTKTKLQIVLQASRFAR